MVKVYGNPNGGNTDPRHPDGSPSVLNDGNLPDVGPYMSPDEAKRAFEPPDERIEEKLARARPIRR